MPENAGLLKTPLYSRHAALDAKMTDEDGWSMPLSYAGVPDEHRAVRTRAGAADVTHLGRLRIRGDGALDLLERICTADVAHQEDDTALPTLLCNERGGIIDACRLLRLDGYWLLITGAGSREKVLGHILGEAAKMHGRDGCAAVDVRADDQTLKTAQLAVTGPAAAGILDAILPVKPSAMPPCAVKVGSLMIARYVAIRTGRAGEWGLEVIIPNMVAGMAWDFITKKAGDKAVPPVGLAVREVLRIEAGEVRCGCEINETIDPITAGLERAVDFGHDFLGAEAVRRIRDEGPAHRRVGLAISPAKGKPPETSIPKQGAPVLRTDGSEVGTVTSGTYSPALEEIIAMAFVTCDAGEAGTELLVGAAERQAAQVVALPFRQPGPVRGAESDCG